MLSDLRGWPVVGVGLISRVSHTSAVSPCRMLLYKIVSPFSHMHIACYAHQSRKNDVL